MNALFFSIDIPLLILGSTIVESFVDILFFSSFYILWFIELSMNYYFLVWRYSYAPVIRGVCELAFLYIDINVPPEWFVFKVYSLFCSRSIP